MARAIVFKECPKCPWRGLQPGSAFYRNKARKDGFDVYCKACKKEQRTYNAEKMQQYRDARRDKLKAYMRTYMSSYRKGERRRQGARN